MSISFRRFYPMVRLAVLLAVLAASAGRGAEPPAGQKYALLVGVRRCSEAKELRPLAFAERNVIDLAEALRDNGYKPENVALMTQTYGADQLRYQPLKTRIRKELALLLVDRKPNDTVFVAFSGHGIRFKDDEKSYLCPADADLEDKETLLSLDGVCRELEAYKAGVKLLLVDASRNDSLVGGAKAPANVDFETALGPPTAGLKSGVAALFSCSEKERSYESAKLGFGNGVFFHHVIDAVRGAAGGEKDDVTVAALADHVAGRTANFVQKEYGKKQTPKLSGKPEGTGTLVAATDEVRAFRRGEADLDKKDYDNAVKEFTEVVRLNPAAAGAFKERGRATVSPKENDKALEDYEEAICINPRYARAINNRGTTHNAKGETDKAIADFTEAIRLDPTFFAFQSNRRTTYLYKGEYAKAADDFTEILLLDPTNATAYVKRAGAYLGANENDKALADCEAAITSKCSPTPPTLSVSIPNPPWPTPTAPSPTITLESTIKPSPTPPRRSV